MKKAADMIIDCLEEKAMSQTQLAASMGEDVRRINQQLNRQADMKVERFTDVLDHIGYRVEVVENDNIRKVVEGYAKTIIEKKEPKGLFWYFDERVYVGIDNLEGNAIAKEFETKEECFAWLREAKK